MYNSNYITLMVQSGYKIFCYFNVSPEYVEELKTEYGEENTRNYKRKIKVYNADTMTEIKTIHIDPFADNWYINMEAGGIKILAELILILSNGYEFKVARSNIVNTPNTN